LWLVGRAAAAASFKLEALPLRAGEGRGPGAAGPAGSGDARLRRARGGVSGRREPGLLLAPVLAEIKLSLCATRRAARRARRSSLCIGSGRERCRSAKACGGSSALEKGKRDQCMDVFCFLSKSSAQCKAVS
jgi:hypothetical protein